jgi:hypothetical protein
MVAHFDLPPTFVECPVGHFAKAVVAYRNIAQLYFSCPSCEHTWDAPKPSTRRQMFKYDEVAVRLERITYAPLSRDSSQFVVPTDGIHREAAVYLALVDARRGVDHKR